MSQHRSSQAASCSPGWWVKSFCTSHTSPGKRRQAFSASRLPPVAPRGCPAPSSASLTNGVDLCFRCFSSELADSWLCGGRQLSLCGSRQPGLCFSRHVRLHVLGRRGRLAPVRLLEEGPGGVGQAPAQRQELLSLLSVDRTSAARRPPPRHRQALNWDCRLGGPRWWQGAVGSGRPWGRWCYPHQQWPASKPADGTQQRERSHCAEMLEKPGVHCSAAGKTCPPGRRGGRCDGQLPPREGPRSGGTAVLQGPNVRLKAIFITGPPGQKTATQQTAKAESSH